MVRIVNTPDGIMQFCFTGTIRTVSSMRIAELKAECVARGLPTEGKKPVLTRTIRNARLANPSIADEIIRKRTLTRKQRKMTTTQEDRDASKVGCMLWNGVEGIGV